MVDASPARSARLLVTGARGRVGRALLPRLQAWDVRAVDSRPSRGLAIGWADMRWPRSAARACRDRDVVVALAALSGVATPWRDVYRTNLRITWNTLDAARRCGVRRVVLASSNNVTGGYEDTEPYRSIVLGLRDGLDPESVPRLDVSSRARPNGPYAIGKVADEAMARYFADTFGLSVLCLRIGTVRPIDRPSTPRHEATLLTHRDLAHLVECCVLAPDDLRFGVYYGVSANTWRIWDTSNARRDLGFEPVDDASALVGSASGAVAAGG